MRQHVAAPVGRWPISLEGDRQSRWEKRARTNIGIKIIFHFRTLLIRQLWWQCSPMNGGVSQAETGEVPLKELLQWVFSTLFKFKFSTSCDLEVPYNNRQTRRQNRVQPHAA